MSKSLELDFRDVAALKGLAITAIVFHNYFHLVSRVHENEFDFDPSRFHVFLETVSHPAFSVQALFSFFGHFGVQVFIFLSAYGISKKHWDNQQSWLVFMWGRIKKLYPVFGVVILGWIIAASAFAPLIFVRRYGLELILMFFGVSNIAPGYGLPPVGPWWFIPFILQFYALWPLMRTITERFGREGLLALSVIGLGLTYTFNPYLDLRWSINLLETPLGHMPEFCLGILAARREIHLGGRYALLACAIVLLGSLYYAFWLFSFIAALFLCLWGYLLVRERLIRYRLPVWIGHYSLLIFLVNAIVRNQFLGIASSPYSQLLFGVVIALLSFGIAAGIEELLPQPPRRQTHNTVVKDVPVKQVLERETCR